MIGGSLIAFGVRGIAKKTSSVALRDIPTTNDRWHRLSWALQAPLNYCINTALSLTFPLPESTGQKIWEIVKRVFKLIVIILLFIPACLLYGIGSAFGRSVGTPRMEGEAMSVTPPPLQTFETNLQNDLGILKGWHANEFSAGQHSAEFNNMIQNVQDRNQAVLKAHSHLPSTFYDDMDLYLNNIIQHLEREPKKRRDVLIALSEAADVCPPTWYETAKKQLTLLTCPNSGEVQLVYWIQEIKEEIILSFAQSNFETNWHALNYVRFHVGEELGLNMEGLSNHTYFERLC